jgi:hypothetical protein
VAVNLTKNKVDLRGFVGRYIKLPSKRGDPARFDIATIERFRTARSGELITQQNWHTIRCFDTDRVRDEIHTGALVELSGRMDSSYPNQSKVVEITVDDFEVILTQDQRSVLKKSANDRDDSGYVDQEPPS